MGLKNFFSELKRRNVYRVAISYGITSWLLAQIAGLATTAFEAPPWVLKIIIIALIIGFPIVLILSWIYDISPQGIVKTKLKDKKFAQPFESSSAKSEHDQKQQKHIIPLQYAKIGSVIILLAVVSLIFILFYRGTSIPFIERDWIVITDFENHTEETIFDKSLNTAFSLNINQSRYINVITRKRMLETLKRMKKEDRQYIDGETGREIAIREGIKIYLVPGISRVGNQYILTVKIQEAKTDSILSSEVLYAKNQDEIIEKLDELTKKVRRNMGESRYEILEQSKPLLKATTYSLEALKQFSLGIENHLNMDFEKAKKHYENAIRIDTNFTSAKASLGNLLFERFDKEEGRKWLEQAILSIDNLTDREKYSILAFYAVKIENDLDKGIEFTETLIDLYPDDPVPHNNLGWYFQNQGFNERAVEEYKTALRIDPYLMFTYSGVIWTYLTDFAQMDSAKTWSKRMIEYGPENAWGYSYLGSVYVGIDSLEKAKNEFLKARDLNSNFYSHFNQYRLAHVYRLQEKYDKAIKVLEEILSKNPKEKSINYDLGVNYNLLGDRKKARSCFLEYKKIAKKMVDEYPDDPNSYIYYGTLLTHLGEKKAGWKIGKRGIEIDSTFHFSFAQLLAAQNKKNEAIDQLEKAFENGYRDLVWVKLHPDLQILQEEAKFQELIDKYFPNNK